MTKKGLKYFGGRFLDLIDKFFFSMKGWMFWVGTAMLFLDRIDQWVWMSLAGSVITGRFLDKTQLNKINTLRGGE